MTAPDTSRQSVTVDLSQDILHLVGFEAHRLDDARQQLSRKPDATELAAAKEFLASQAVSYAVKPDWQQRAGTAFCPILLASNAFLYIE